MSLISHLKYRSYSFILICILLFVSSSCSQNELHKASKTSIRSDSPACSRFKKYQAFRIRKPNIPSFFSSQFICVFTLKLFWALWCLNFLSLCEREKYIKSAWSGESRCDMSDFCLYLLALHLCYCTPKCLCDLSSSNHSITCEKHKVWHQTVGSLIRSWVRKGRPQENASIFSETFMHH